MANIFVSHAAADEPLVNAFVDLLQTGGDLRSGDISCTSIDGMGIETGEDFVDWIREELSVAELVILLLSPNYFASRFCVAEMGAAWGSGLRVFPLVHPAMPRDVGAILLGRQTARLDNSGLDELRDRIARTAKSAARNTGRWNLKKDEFIATLPRLLERLPQPDLVDLSRLVAEQAKVAAAGQIEEERREEIRELKQRIAELKELKDADAVLALEAQHQPSDTEWKARIAAAQEAIQDLDAPAVRALYATCVGAHWKPSSNTWDYWRDEIMADVERMIVLQDDSGIWANTDHPRVCTALAALESLSHFLSEEMGEDLSTHLATGFDYPLSAENREFWEDQLYGERFLD